MMFHLDSEKIQVKWPAYERCRTLRVIGTLADQRRIVADEAARKELTSMALYPGWLVTGQKEISPAELAGAEYVMVKISTDKLDDWLCEKEIEIIASLGKAPGFPVILNQGLTAVVNEGSDGGPLGRYAPYFVMPFIDGKDLDQYTLRGWAGKEPAREELGALTEKYLPGLAERLAFLHERGIVHRDVKGNNAMVDSKAEVTLLDFGRANFLTAEPRSDTGAAGYYPPELELKENGPEDVRTDVYGLGVTAFTVLTGERGLLYEGMDNIWRYTGVDFLMSGMFGVTREKVVQGYYRRIRELAHLSTEELVRRSNLPAELKSTSLGQYLMKLMHPDREQRPVNLREVANELRRLGAQFSRHELSPVEAG